MNKINWHSKVLWTSATALMVVLIQQILKLFGIEFSSDIANQVQAIINTILTILGMFGIVYDTSKGENNEK